MLDLKSIAGKNITIQDKGIILSKDWNEYLVKFDSGVTLKIQDYGNFKVGQEVVYALQSGKGSEPKKIAEYVKD